MTSQEWESLCDGCARCCLYKFQDDDTGEYFFTNVACKLLDILTCRCTDYPARSRLNLECVTLDPEKSRSLDWLPSTCAYRLLAQGKSLEWWHPLVSGNPETVIMAGISVRGQCISERDIGPASLEDFIIG